MARALPSPLASLVAAIVLGALACGSIREDQLECEEAVTKLEGCCSDFNASPIQCVYTSGCEDTTYPDLDIPTSDCIRGESCAEIVSTGVCGRALQAHPVETSQGELPEADGPATAGVCP